MDNLHAPTVPSGPTNSTSRNASLDRLTLQELQQKKEIIEAELRALGAVLDSHGARMDTPLTTADGFPRADIDVAQVRTIRARVIHLRNDFKDLMNAIEAHLHRHFASIGEQADDSTAVAETSTAAPACVDDAFAKVNTVVPGSPADRAGLQVGDQIRNFGHANSSNHENLKRVAECVQANEGRSVLVKILRMSEQGTQRELQLTVVPMTGWGGRGLLGCHILPI